jgi:hypothetical protein
MDENEELRDPDHFNIMFNENSAGVDPFDQYEQLPRMPYLEFDIQNTELNAVERKQLHNDEERQALLDQSLASARGAGGIQARSLSA